jgi:hypothetical protein
MFIRRVRENPRHHHRPGGGGGHCHRLPLLPPQGRRRRRSDLHELETACVVHGIHLHVLLPEVPEPYPYVYVYACRQKLRARGIGHHLHWLQRTGSVGAASKTALLHLPPLFFVFFFGSLFATSFISRNKGPGAKPYVLKRCERAERRLSLCSHVNLKIPSSTSYS